MLKTVEYSRAKKTRGIGRSTNYTAVTYRAGDGSNYGTCPASCELNPSGLRVRQKLMLSILTLF